MACALVCPPEAYGSRPAPLPSLTRTRTRALPILPALALQVYWAKHRIELDATMQALADAKAGALEASKGEPDAERMERK